MRFVHPEFLWALVVLSIPLVIHLFNFRRFRTIYFTNVRFLRQIQEETATRNRLKHLLVLLSRLLALSALVLAFAQPFIPSATAKQKATEHAVGIYIDNSFSMESVMNDEKLLDIAKRKAEEITNGYSIDDKFQLITNDFEARHQRLLGKEEILQMITEVQLSPVVQPLNEIFKREKETLNRSGEKDKQVYFLSDFQKNAMNLENDTAFQMHLVRIESSRPRNLSVDSLWFVSPVQMTGVQLQLCFTVKNYGDDDLKNVPVTLKLNNQIKSISDIDIPANSESTDTLTFTVNEAAWQNGEVSVADYPVSFDDIFYFSFEPLSKIPVLCINGVEPNVYIGSAFGNNTVFDLVNYPAEQIQFSELGKFNLIILNELTTISGGLSQAIREQVAKGASLVVIPSFSMDKNSVNQLLSELKAGQYGEVNSQKRSVVEINTRHPLFADVFEKIPKNLATPSAVRSFVINSFSTTAEEPVMAFSDNKPMMATYRSTAGQVLMLATPLEKDVTDLPVQGGYFVLVMYKYALSSQRTTTLYTSIGDDQWITLRDISTDGDATIKIQGKQSEFIPAMRKSGTETEINAGSYAKDAGIYFIEGSPSGQSLAMNYNRSESNLSFVSDDELKKMFDSPNVSVIDNPSVNLTGVVAQLSSGTALWKYCVIFALLFLAIEIILIRWMP